MNCVLKNLPLWAVGFLALAGCATSAQVRELHASIRELKPVQQPPTECVRPQELALMNEKLTSILERLEKLERPKEKPQPPPRRPGRPDPQATYAFDVEGLHTKGSPLAWVTIVEIGEFQCPYCRRVQPTLDAILEKYGDKVRIAFAHNPLSFHRHAMPAAIAAECAAKEQKFWPMHDVLFENIRRLEDAQLRGYAQDLGLNMKRFDQCFESGAPKEKIKTQQRRATKLGARGTPSFFINGRFLSGAQPLASFEKLIDEELARARASGISKGEYYTKAVVEKGLKSLD